MKKGIILLASIFMCFMTVQAFSAVYILQLNGMCSQQWLDSSGDRLANSSGKTAINCVVDNNTSVAYSASQFKTKYLDVYCKNSNWCYIINYSAGDPIMGYLNAAYAPLWNIAYIYTTAGAGGGSEVAGSFTALFKCAIVNDLSVSKVRSMYNHNDTNGVINYRIGGSKAIWYSPGSMILPGEDDGAVAFHSSGNCVTAGSYSNFTQCSHFTNSIVYGSQTGYYLDHYGMKMKFISLLGW